MAQDIKILSLAELQQDLLESKSDILVCKTALLHEITQYSGGSVQRRLEVNEKIVIAIKAELKRRKNG